MPHDPNIIAIKFYLKKLTTVSTTFDDPPPGVFIDVVGIMYDKVVAYNNLTLWPFYNMVFHKSVLLVSGQKKWAGWLIKKLDPARALRAKNQILPATAFSAQPYY